MHIIIKKNKEDLENWEETEAEIALIVTKQGSTSQCEYLKNGEIHTINKMERDFLTYAFLCIAHTIEKTGGVSLNKIIVKELLETPEFKMVLESFEDKRKTK